MMIELPSIVSVINSETLFVYASYAAGGYDTDSGIHISRLPSTWYRRLDEWDYAAVQTVLDVSKYLN